MKYRTKEWYQLCQNQFDYFRFKADERAEIFSEEYYQELYQQKLNKFLTWIKERYDEDPEYGLKYGFPETYNQEELINYFKKNHETSINELKNDLFPEILTKVADLRVCSLGVVSADVLGYITIWCEANGEQTRVINQEYFAYEKNSKVAKEILDNYSFHDCRVIEAKKVDQDYVIKFETQSGFSSVEFLIFHNYRIIELDGDLAGAWWLYDEVYAVEGGNEYHSLVQLQDRSLAYVTIFATDVEFIESTES